MHIVKLCDNAVHNTPPESLIQSAALRTTPNRSGLEIALNNSLTAPVYSNTDKAVTEIGYVNAGLNRCFGKCTQQRRRNAAEECNFRCGKSFRRTNERSGNTVLQ